MDVTVLSLRDKYSDEDLSHWLPLQPQLFDVFGSERFGYAPGMLKNMESHECDILHCHGIWMYPALANLLWHKRTKIPYVISPHGMVDPWALKNSKIKKAFANIVFEKSHLKSASGLRSLCLSETESIRQLLGKDTVVFQIPNGIDLPSATGSSRPAWMPQGKKIMFYLGRIHPKKGLVPLLRAWALLDQKDRKDWCLAVAGWDQGGHEDDLKLLAKNLGIQETVLFPGALFNDDKDAGYRHSNAFILSSYSEGLPMSVLEAWAFELPAIISPDCNLPEGIAAGAALITEVEPNDIALQLRSLFQMSSEQRKAMGQAGKKLVSEHFSWDSIAKQLADVYKWILGSGSKPSCVV